MRGSGLRRAHAEMLPGLGVSLGSLLPETTPDHLTVLGTVAMSWPVQQVPVTPDSLPHSSAFAMTLGRAQVTLCRAVPWQVWAPGLSEFWTDCIQSTRPAQSPPGRKL